MQKVILQTQHPIAVDSPDHLYPVGTANDNSTNDKFINDVLTWKNKPNVMDLGCAGGQYIVDMFNKGCLAVGVEGSDYCLRNRRFNWPNYYNKVLFTGDITKPYKVLNENEQVKFDLITAWEVVEHIHGDDLYQFFSNIANNLKIGGIFYGSVASSDSLANGVVEKHWKQEGIDRKLTKEERKINLHQSNHTEVEWLEIILPEIFETVPLEIIPAPFEGGVRLGTFKMSLRRV